MVSRDDAACLFTTAQGDDFAMTAEEARPTDEGTSSSDNETRTIGRSVVEFRLTRGVQNR